jgi:hypothetical protein
MADITECPSRARSGHWRNTACPLFDELLILGMSLLPGGISCSESRWMIELQFPRLVGSAAMRGRFINRRGRRRADTAGAGDFLPEQAGL